MKGGRPIPAAEFFDLLDRIAADTVPLADVPRDLRSTRVATLSRRDHALYVTTRNAAHVWATYRRMRHIGSPVPAWVLAALDEFAITNGRPAARSKAPARQRWAIANAVLDAQHQDVFWQQMHGTTPREELDIMDLVSKRFGRVVAKRFRHVSTEHVRNCYYKLTETDPDPTARPRRRMKTPA